MLFVLGELETDRPDSQCSWRGSMARRLAGRLAMCNSSAVVLGKPASWASLVQDCYGADANQQVRANGLRDGAGSSCSRHHNTPEAVHA